MIRTSQVGDGMRQKALTHLIKHLPAWEFFDISNSITQSKSKNKQRVWLKVKITEWNREHNAKKTKHGRWKWARILGIIFSWAFFFFIKAALIQVDEGRKRLGSLAELHTHASIRSWIFMSSEKQLCPQSVWIPSAARRYLHVCDWNCNYVTVGCSVWVKELRRLLRFSHFSL